MADDTARRRKLNFDKGTGVPTMPGKLYWPSKADRELTHNLATKTMRSAIPTPTLVHLISIAVEAIAALDALRNCRADVWAYCPFCGASVQDEAIHADVFRGTDWVECPGLELQRIEQ